ncbi:MAG: hypothetical protein WA952_00035, partial [Lewinella sp.]
IGQGDWTLTRDRNFIKLTDAAYQTSRLQFIDRFDGNSLTLTMPLKIKTREPRGTQLESYYNGVAEVNFRR